MLLYIKDGKEELHKRNNAWENKIEKQWKSLLSLSHCFVLICILLWYFKLDEKKIIN